MWAIWCDQQEGIVNEYILFLSVFSFVHRWQAKAPALFFCLCSFGVFFFFPVLINKGEPGCMGVADCSPGTTEAPLSSSPPPRFAGWASTLQQ